MSDPLESLSRAAAELPDDFRLTVNQHGVVVHYLNAGAVPGTPGSKLVSWFSIRNRGADAIQAAAQKLETAARWVAQQKE